MTIVGLAAAHTAAELYAILTRLPPPLRVSSQQAEQLISRDVVAVCQIVALSVDDYLEVIRRLSGLGVVGGATYDGLILEAAVKGQADQILTLNGADFRRVHPAVAHLVAEP